MGHAADLGHRLQQAEEVRVRYNHSGDGAARIGQHPLQCREIGRSGVWTLGDQGDLVRVERCPAEVGAHGLAIVWVHAATDQDPLATRRPAGHQGALGRGRRAVVVRRGDDVETGQLGQKRLVFVDRLKGALADLGLVGRVGGVELAPEQQLVNDRGNEVTVSPGTEEADQVDTVAIGQCAKPVRQVDLRFGLR